jgi:spore coat protein CotH
LHGRRALTLNNMLQDGTLMAERLAYEVFREMGAPASRANHAMVYVNDEYYGLYANIETPNEEFLEHWFDDPDRTLYEEAGRDFDRRKTAQRFERETNERQSDDRENLRALEEACIASNLGRVRELVDWQKFLLFSALEAAVNQVDGYSYAQSGPNNYRIYDSAHGLIFIPWGLDWAFGPVATQDGGLFVDPFWARPKHGVLMRMCLADAECRQEYRAAVGLVAARWDGMKLEEKMARWAEQTQGAAESDERRESSYESVLADRENTLQFIRGRAQALLDAIETS